MEEKDVASGQSSEDSKGYGRSDGTNTEARVSPETNFSQLFKNNGKTLESAIDQRKLTYHQVKKEKYSELVDKNRELSELFEEIEVGDLLENVMEYEVGAEVENEMQNQPMETDAPVTYHKKKIIMFRVTESEWLTEIPEDFPDDWLVKFCPKGSRRLVLCKERTTKVFDKYGIFQWEFQSNIPGGGGHPEFSCSTPGLTVLDCVYHNPTGTFFILDVIIWNGASLLNCDAEMRHYFIRSKYLENPEYFEEYDEDSFRFEVAYDYGADPSNISLHLSQYDTYCNVACEGVLFYHRESPYISGSTDREVEKMWKTEKMNMEITTIEAPVVYIPRRATAHRGKSVAHSSRMDFAP
ncbi:hypothetical protein WA026_023728 [Henosepilachna vigintioctopunctata]|uniref:Snurportin-1 n=1 Tax=Henosepilachna vigintioctopunctata TaxID=420089 RepID=A0AAW1V3E7_9CUCU